MLWDFISAAALEVARRLTAWLVRRAVAYATETRTMARNDSKPAVEYYTVPEAARLLGLPPIQVVRTYERGFMPPARRFGRMRMIPVGDLDRLRQAAKEAGYEPKS